MLGHRCVATLSGVLCSLLVLATYACADATSASRPEYRTAIRLRLANLKQNVQRHQQLLAALSLKQQPDMEEAEENNGAASNPHGELSVLLKRLEELEQKLSQMQNDIADIQGWIEGQTESLMVMANDITDMKRFRASTNCSSSTATPTNQAPRTLSRCVASESLKRTRSTPARASGYRSTWLPEPIRFKPRCAMPNSSTTSSRPM